MKPVISKHFVTFYSPGTFVAETSTLAVDRWDVAIALTMARDIKERHNATPYGFQFTTKSRGERDLDSCESARSPMYYFGVKVESLAQVKARATDADRILISNMECNDWPHVVTTLNGWKCTLPLRTDDVVLDGAGQPVARS